MIPANSLVALLTDFGLQDTYVGQMKGVMLSINPALRVVDLTHYVPRHNVAAGAFILSTAYRSFPLGTIFVAVVDPGVGGSRRPVLIATEEYYFVGPDNGLFTLIVLEAGPGRWKVWHLDEPRWWRSSVSRTFHGRDIFAPVAAWLSTGIAPDRMGKPISDPVLLDLPLPHTLADGSVVGQVIHVDSFGNLITNLRPPEGPASVEIEGRVLGRLRSSYSEVDVGQPLALVGSAGFIEIAVREGDAARYFQLSVGAKVVVRPAIT